MLHKLIVTFSLCILSINTFSAIVKHTTPSKINRVIYITLDGVRWQDVYLSHAYFKKFWQNYASNAHFYGAPQSDRTMEVASTPISLPSYQSQMTGAVQPCQDNNCGRVLVETFPEYLVNTLKLPKQDVVIISSWSDIENAVQHIPNTIFANTGNKPMLDPNSKMADGVMSELNAQQSKDYHIDKEHPQNYHRFDKYTWAQAMHYLATYKPRFMWISLQDGDEAAHEKNLALYHQALTNYDNSLDSLFKQLKQMGVNKETMVIVTTDHGRGNDKNWHDHSHLFPEAKQTWAFVINGKLKLPKSSKDNNAYNTLSIRPTIESVFVAAAP